MIHAKVIQGSVPSHPDPLPQGEGTADERPGFVNAHAVITALRSSLRLWKALPLPQREGRGEGRHTTINPLDSFVISPGLANFGNTRVHSQFCFDPCPTPFSRSKT